MVEDGIIKIKTVNGVKRGITLDDLRQVLVVSYRTHGEIVALAPINKWAKYKHVIRPELHFSRQINSDFTWKTKQQIEALGETPWWLGTNGQCGLTFQTYNSLGTNTIGTSGFFYNLLKTTPSWALAWGYERPTGAIGTDPFRYRDMNYYYHAAPKPVEGVFDNLKLVDSGNGTTYNLTVQLDETRAQDSLGLQLSDLEIGGSAVSGWYIGILLYKSNSKFTYAFSSNTIGDGDLSVSFSGLDAGYAGNAKIVPFLASKKSNYQGTDPGNGTYLSCDVAPQDVTIGIADTNVTTTIYAQWKANGLARYAVNIINNSGSQVSISSMVIALYDQSQNVDTDTVLNATIPAHSNREFSGTLDPGTYDATKRYEVVVATNPTVSGVDGARADVEFPRT